MLGFVAFWSYLEHSAGQHHQYLQGQPNDNLEIYLSAQSNSVYRKEYRVGDPPHLKNNNIARLWGEH